MDRAVLATLSMTECQLVEQTQVAALASLDEDETADLLLRVRRTRNKYTKLYATAVDELRGVRGRKGPRT